ncbi:uncharacterized protein LOC114129556 [Aphis gossypii]|uniref:uncharacterized protein LOC114129556 n=1 Tax=Aphis gossypii TaxID=80765 RepID=UPI0021598E9E|nr:uncharacterized protein LOC114129556 [Aphis gossypii]
MSTEVGSIRNKLAEWSIKHRITHAAISDLLVILKSSYDSSLPIDARTLLKTDISNSKIILKEVPPGFYYHFGIKSGIKNHYDFTDDSNGVIKLVVGIDGLPLTKSSKSTFWPILCYIRPHSQVVFPVGIYWGNEKPTESNVFMHDFVLEISDLITNGIEVQNKKGILYKLKVIMDVFVCDVPAKSYILKTKSHSGFFSCSRCFVEGNYTGHRVCFPDLNCTKRTHENFITKQNEEHHIGMSLSIITDIPGIDIIKSFSLDYMHLICLGVMKKMINLWLKGPLINRIGSRKSTELSILLLSMKQYTPVDFQRKPRGLDEFNRWKATELRMFLLYFGPVVLKYIINKKCYLNFLCLHVSMRLLLTPNISDRYLTFCRELLNYFIKTFSKIYGEQFISHNIHALEHICDDYINFGPLDNCSAFPFENHMSVLKKYLRKSHQPLQQAVKRYNEETKYLNTQNSNVFNKDSFLFKQPHHDGPLPIPLMSKNVNQYKIVKLKNMEIRCNEKDCYVQTVEKTVFKVVNIIKNIEDTKNECILIGYTFYDTSLFYNQPISSSKLGIVSITNSYCDNLIQLPITQIVCKFIFLKTLDDKQSAIVIPILHTL